MPHVEVKCYPGRTEDQKQLLADCIAEDISRILGANLSSVSVSIVEVPPESWKDQVWDRQIVPNKDHLYKHPEYSCD